MYMGRRSMGQHPMIVVERRRRHRPRLAVPANAEPERRDEEIAQLKARLAELEARRKEGD
jgi:hypothetical protein